MRDRSRCHDVRGRRLVGVEWPGWSRSAPSIWESAASSCCSASAGSSLPDERLDLGRRLLFAELLGRQAPQAPGASVGGRSGKLRASLAGVGIGLGVGVGAGSGWTASGRGCSRRTHHGDRLWG